MQEIQIEDEILDDEELIIPTDKPKVRKRTTPKCNYCNKDLIFETREEKRDWQKADSVCPHCFKKYCDKPPTEIELMQLQTVYLENRVSDKDLKKSKGSELYHELIHKKHKSDKALFELCEIIKKYSESLLHKKFKRATRDREEMAEYVESISLLMLETYLSRPGFKVEGSFWGYLFRIARGVIYQRKEMTLEKQAQLKGVNLVSMDYEVETKDAGTITSLQIADPKADDFKDQKLELYESVILCDDLEEAVRETSLRVYNPYIDIMRIISTTSLVRSRGSSNILNNTFTSTDVRKYTNQTMNTVHDIIYTYMSPEDTWRLQTKIEMSDFKIKEESNIDNIDLNKIKTKREVNSLYQTIL